MLGYLLEDEQAVSEGEWSEDGLTGGVHNYLSRKEFAVYIFCLKDLLILHKVVGGLAVMLTTSCLSRFASSAEVGLF